MGQKLGVVEAEVVTDTDPGISAILISFQIHFFLFHYPPQPLDEQVIICNNHSYPKFLERLALNLDYFYRPAFFLGIRG